MIDTNTQQDTTTSGAWKSEQSAVTLVIFGAGGVAREVFQLVKDLARAGAQIGCAGFLIDSEYRKSELVCDLPVLGDANYLQKNREVTVTIAVGSPAARRRIAERIERDCDPRFMTLIHPRATIGDSVSIGNGAVAFAGSVATTDILIGTSVQLHVNSAIGHDAVIESFATIAPGAIIGGAALIGEGAFVGSGAVILPRCKIGQWSIIGAGSVITEDVPENSTAVGAPAAVMAQREQGWHLGADHDGIERLYFGSRR